MKRLTFEIDTEPYASSRDDEISNLAEKNGIEVIRKTSHTLYNPRDIVKVRPYFFYTPPNVGARPFPGTSLDWVSVPKEKVSCQSALPVLHIECCSLF